MVLPETWPAVVTLLIISALCFAVWPNLFKTVGSKWRFELFSLDFSLGAMLLALTAAYTLGSRGSELGFSDNMLVAGRRAEVMAVATGEVFAFGNMLYLGTIALMGLSNATLLTFSVFGAAVALLQLQHGHYLTAGLAFLLLGSAAALTPKSAKAGIVTGILSGVVFAAVIPVLGLAQTPELGIGAYGGMLMAAIGILVATLFLNFFFLNISLEGGRISYADYLKGSGKSHGIGIASGAIWATGALALYAAKTGTAVVTSFNVWLVPFAGAVLTVITGVIFWQKMQLSPAARRNKLISALLFVCGLAVLLSGFFP